MGRLRRIYNTVIAPGGPSDTTAPTAVITSSESSPTATSPIPMTITFSEVVTGFGVGDITAAGCTFSDFATADNIVWTVTATPTAYNFTVDIAGGVCVDAAGNANTAASQFVMVATSKWYLAGGVPVANCLAAYQPLGAASYAASLLNLINPATHVLDDTGRVPAWNVNTGWAGASGKALTTDIPPEKEYTMIARVASLDNTEDNNSVARSYNFQEWYYGIDYGGNPSVRFFNGNYVDIAGVASPFTGTLALAGRLTYVDGVNKTTIADFTWLGSPTAMILLNRTGYDAPMGGNLLAWAIYSVTLDAETIAALHTAMAALP